MSQDVRRPRRGQGPGVEAGYGHAYVDDPFGHMDVFRSAEREAREARRGLWGCLSLSRARVWVNTSSKVYHCPGTRHYGNTARGAYMTESEAQQQGLRAAYGRFGS